MFRRANCFGQESHWNCFTGGSVLGIIVGIILGAGVLLLRIGGVGAGVLGVDVGGGGFWQTGGLA